MPNARIRRLWELDPEWGHAPWRAAPDRIERVLHVHLATPEEPQTALCRALASLTVADGYRRVDWPALAPVERRRAVLDAARAHRPTLVFLQLQRPDVLDPGALDELRRAAPREVVVASWCGDVGGVNGPFSAPGDRWAYDLSACCDLMLYSSMSQVRAHRSRGMHNAAYLQIGYDDDRYFEGPDERYGARHDVAFLGSNYDDRQWGSLPGHEAALRRELADAMRGALGARFGLFGRGWSAGAAHLAPAESGAVYRGAHLALSVSLCNALERYSSDRLLRALACGVPVLMKGFDDWRSFGLVSDESVIPWETAAEAVALARAWLAPGRAEERRALGRRGAALARAHHSWGVRMQELCPLVAATRGARPEVTRPW